MISSSETASAVLDKGANEAGTDVMILKNYVNGAFVQSNSERVLDIIDPSNGNQLAKLPLTTESEFNEAVELAQKAFPAWRRTPPVKRARYFFKLKTLMEERFDDIARVLTLEHGKTFDEARGSVRRAVENVEVATA